MRIVDTRGQLCPEPLIAAKRALKETVIGESFILLTDNQTSLNNLSRFLKDNNIEFQVSEDQGLWRLTINKTTGQGPVSKIQDNSVSGISHFRKGEFVIVFTSDKMGEGDNDLGHLLIVNFIKALKDLDRLPRKMVFYNGGVKLVSNNSPVIEHLKDLDKMGVELLLCATCVNYYSLDALVGVGTLSNMFEIAEVMASAESVIRP